MKGFGKRAALALCALVLMAAMPWGAWAASQGERGEALRETAEGRPGQTAGLTLERSFSAAPGQGTDGSLYSQLSPRQQRCYEALEAISIGEILAAQDRQGYRQLEVAVPQVQGMALTGSISGGTFTPDDASAGEYRALFTDLCAAITALRYDRPDALWLSEMRYGITWNRSGSQVVVEKAVFAFRLKYGGEEERMWEEQMAWARSLADQAREAGGRYEQVLAVHNLLAAQSEYNYGSLQRPGTREEELSHQAYSCLVPGDGYEPVCDGYAKAVKVVCDLLEIPCVLASSATHMWNNVYMDDGAWYNLDLTWDDAHSGELSYDYFLVGSQTVVRGEAFSQQGDHREQSPWQEDATLDYVPFAYPQKSQKAYVPREGGYGPLRFPDVLYTDWYYDYVEQAAVRGLFSGDDQGYFRPERDITRGEFVRVLYQAVDPQGYAPGETGGFADVDSEDWYYLAVRWAAERGYVSGYGDGSFRPEDPISREEMCVILCHCLADLGRGGAGELPFRDAGEISPWAREAVSACQALGLVAGDENGDFCPKAGTLRCQAATVFVKFARVLDAPPPSS